MSVKTTTLPKRSTTPSCAGSDVFMPDYDFLMENWEKHFPNEPALRALRLPRDGDVHRDRVRRHEGQAEVPEGLARCCPSRPTTSSAPIRAQASTEFGSIQQHQLTLARAQDEEEQFWVLRMMAEELRHGYQMLHLLLEDDWTSVSKESSADMVEEILSMNTGSHVLGAFNIDFDSFVDNIVFCALIDRVGKYQLAMQKVSRLPADGGEHAADAARGGLPPRGRRRADAPLGRGGRAGARSSSPWGRCRRRSTSGCRAGSRCSATSAAGRPERHSPLPSRRRTTGNRAVSSSRRGRRSIPRRPTRSSRKPTTPTRGAGQDVAIRLFRLEAARRGLATLPTRPVGRGEPSGNSAAAARLEEIAQDSGADEHRTALLYAAARWIDESGRDLSLVVREGNFRKVFPFGALAAEAEAAFRESGAA